MKTPFCNGHWQKKALERSDSLWTKRQRGITKGWRQKQRNIKVNVVSAYGLNLQAKCLVTRWARWQTSSAEGEMTSRDKGRLKRVSSIRPHLRQQRKEEKRTTRSQATEQHCMLQLAPKQAPIPRRATKQLIQPKGKIFFIYFEILQYFFLSIRVRLDEVQHPLMKLHFLLSSNVFEESGFQPAQYMKYLCGEMVPCLHTTHCHLLFIDRSYSHTAPTVPGPNRTH